LHKCVLEFDKADSQQLHSNCSVKIYLFFFSENIKDQPEAEDTQRCTKVKIRSLVTQTPHAVNISTCMSKGGESHFTPLGRRKLENGEAAQK